ncbi:MAG: TsoY family (seleno)protein, partial [Rubricella sp.]
MSIFPPSKGDGYGPLYLLASVGAGGLTVSFFMWLMFWVPHPGRPVPIFEDISAALTTGGPVLQAAIVGALLGIAAFALLQIRLLIWNIAELRRFRLGDGWTKARASNAESQILALPLALAMMVNVGFILGLVFVPGLWSIVE